MSDLRGQVEEIGRRIWPDRAAAYGAVQARRRRRRLGLPQPRRPRLAARWLPVLAAVATAAILLTLAGNRPAEERTEGQGRHAVIPATPPTGSLDARTGELPDAPGRGRAVAPAPRTPAEAPPAPNPATQGTGRSAGAAPQQPPAPGAEAATVTLTEADNGSTVTVSPGTRIVVNLPGSARRQWTVPRTLDPTVVSAAESGRDGAGGAHGTFTALRSGRTRLMAGQGGCHGPLCLIASPATWQVRVVVR